MRLPLKYFLILFVLKTTVLSSQINFEGGYILVLRNEYKPSERTSLSNNNIFCISPELRLYYVKDTLDIAHLDLNIESIIFNVKLESRNVPNDPQFTRQSYINFTNLDKFWTLTTGNNTSKKCVIAIIEKGIDVNHEDLKENIYYNNAEILNDLIDNDLNGYIDDYSGINTDKFNSSVHNIETHGTWVAGIAGARGNNNIGISGVMWNTSILPISGVDTPAEVFLAYQYIYKNRKLYNESEGKKGINIVVSNLSLGKRGDHPEEKKIWCEFYDLMGSVGVLSFGAAPNTSVDVGVDLDLPTSCSSKYLINVTSINEQGFLSDAGYSKQFIHLAAPGENIFGLKSNNGYGAQSGTSASTPIVAGLAGLINSISCTYLDELKLFDPSKHAETVAKIINEGVKQTPNLQNKVIYGGYIDAFGSLREVSRYCPVNTQVPANKGKLKIDKLSLNENNLLLEYTSPDFSSYQFSVIDVSQKVILNTSFTPSEFGINTLNFRLPSMPSGLYLIILQGQNQSAYQFISM